MNLTMCKIKAALLIASVLIIAGTVMAAAGRGDVLGDSDGDGNVNINDVTSIQMTLAELPVIGGFYESAADVDNNGVIDIADATYIQRWLAEMETSYSIGVQFTESSQPATDEHGFPYVVYRP